MVRRACALGQCRTGPAAAMLSALRTFGVLYNVLQTWFSVVVSFWVMRHINAMAG